MWNLSSSYNGKHEKNIFYNDNIVLSAIYVYVSKIIDMKNMVFISNSSL